MTRLIEKVALKEQLLLDKRAVIAAGQLCHLVKCIYPTFAHKRSHTFILCNIHFELVGPKYSNKKVVYVIVLKVLYFMQPA